jgi:hypothetical protein
MASKKKRTGLDELDLKTIVSPEEKSLESSPQTEAKAEVVDKSGVKDGKDIAKTTVYVPRAVFEQWRELAFTERKRMHDYLIEGLERVFQDRGLKSFDDLSE